jgi:hypothetical protein
VLVAHSPIYAALLLLLLMPRVRVAQPSDAVRISRMLPLYPPPPTSAGDLDARLALAEGVRGLQAQLENAAPLVGVPPLSTYHTELAYLYYPVGGMYRRHVDVPSTRGGWLPMGRAREDGGSFSGAALRREISMLLYLDAGWDPAWGGHLRIFEPDGDDEAEERTTDVVPEGGTLVLMRSDRVPHEVGSCSASNGSGTHSYTNDAADDLKSACALCACAAGARNAPEADVLGRMVQNARRRRLERC